MFGASSRRRRRRQDRPDPRPVHGQGEKWFNDGVWKDHFIPNATQIDSDLLDKGNEFAVGQPGDGRDPHLVHVLHQPGRAGQAKLQLRLRGRAGLQRQDHAPSSTPTRSASSRRPRSRRGLQGPDGAGRSRPSCSTIYGAMPADPAKQQAFFDTDRRSNFPGIKLDWTVPQAMLAYPDIPNHQSWMPELREVEDRLAGLPEQVPDHERASTSTPSSATLKTTLQGIFDELGAVS